MKKNKESATSAAELRRQAEATLSKRKKTILDLSTRQDETLRLVHELQVHQIELEMQNEELMIARSQEEWALQQYTDLYDFAPVGYFSLSNDSTILSANLKGAMLLGEEREQLLKRRLGLFLSKESRIVFNDFLSKIFQSGEKQSCEVEIKQDEQNSIRAHFEGRISENKQECYAIMTDITDRRLAETKLRASEELYRLLTENALDVIWVMDIESHTFRYVSPSVERLRGYRVEEVLKQDIGTTLTPDSLAHLNTFAKERLELFRKGCTDFYTDEFEEIHKDGHTVWTEVISRFMVNPTSGKIEITGVTRDISNRKQTEKELNLLSHALKSISECVSITDMHDRVLFINNAFIQTYGYTEDECLGRNIEFIRSSRNPHARSEEILPSTLGGGWSGELINRKKDGSEFPVYLSTSIIRDEKAEPVALVGVATDITERTFAETKRKSLEAQLQQAQKLESLGTLASGIAHDFNNLLGIIIGYASIIDHLPPDPAFTKKSTDAIVTAGMRGSALVKQLLTFARKTDIFVQSVQLNDIVLEVSKLLGETLPKNIEIHLKLEKPIPSIIADAGQIHQVLLNLCVNARDAMPEGGTISITTYITPVHSIVKKFPKALADEYLVLRVSDNGSGMDEATRSRIFEPFFTTKEFGKGTGLGLSLVFGIVESHKGFIEVESTPHVGTTFHLYFPLPLQFVKIEENKEYISEPIIGGNETILLIEDEELLRGLVNEMLKLKGYNVLIAEDGEDAVRQYQQHQEEIQLVVSDFGLPKLNGFQVFKKIKAINPAVKVIIASGYVEPERKSEMLDAGVQEIIRKPFSVDKLLRCIRSVLDEK